MTRKDREASRKELEASAERVGQEIARKMREGMLRFFDRLEDVLPDTVRVMRDAQTKGEAVDRVKLRGEFAREARVAAAVNELPARLTHKEFEALPIIDLNQISDPPERLSRLHLAGSWIVVESHTPGRCVLMKPNIGDASSQDLN